VKFPNLVWAINDQRMAHYQAAAKAGMGESRFSRCLSGRSEFTSEEQRKIGSCLGYPATWLFQEVSPPCQGPMIGNGLPD